MPGRGMYQITGMKQGILNAPCWQKVSVPIQHRWWAVTKSAELCLILEAEQHLYGQPALCKVPHMLALLGAEIWP